jgi:hypothetical protein
MGDKWGKIKPSKSLQAVQPKPVAKVHTPVSISFRYFQPGAKYCLSLCDRDTVRIITDCLRLLTTMTWQEVLQTGGKGKNKAGLGFTPYPDNTLRGISRPLNLSADIPISGVRASNCGRVFGAYYEHVYYVLWFDPQHDIVPA